MNIEITTRGKNPFPDTGALRSDVRRVLRRVSGKVRQSYVEHEIAYSGGLDIRVDASREDTIRVSSRNEHFYWVVMGTNPHKIVAKPGRVLRFNSAYDPGTQVYTIQSRVAQSYGPQVYAKSIQHPGITARKTHRAIADEHRPLFIKLMREATSARGLR